MPSYLINKIKDIENKFYLELGVHVGNHFKSILAKYKVGVDIDYEPTYKMTTDEFFQRIAGPEDGLHKVWNIVFIDADHTWSSVLKDFNNTVGHLEEPSVVFLHDLYPKDKILTAPHYCGDAYKFLDALYLMRYPDVYVQTPPTDYGLTMILNPRMKVPISFIDPLLSYENFLKNVKDITLYTPEEQEEILHKNGW